MGREIESRRGIGPKHDFFIYVVKPKPKLSLNYLVNFSSPKNPRHKV
jgi:hypothetical protein